MSNPVMRALLRHPVFVLLLPAVLIGVGIWQLSRAGNEADALAARTARLEASMNRLRPLAARDPGAVVRFNGSDRGYTAALALQMMDEERTKLRRDPLVTQGRAGAAWGAVAGGAVGLLAGLAGLAATALGARRSMASRTRLVGAFRGVVRMLPPLLGILTVATAVGVTAAVLFEAGGAWYLDQVSTGEVKLLLVGLLIAAGALFYAFNSVRQLRRALDAFTPHPMQVLGRAVGPAEAPGLWALLADVAGRQGAAMPDNIVLGLTGGFFVTSSRVLTAPEDRVLAGGTLYLPATYLPLLSREEVMAIIAHELAHFTGEDTQYSLHFLPLYASMSRSMAAVTDKQRTRTGFDILFQPAAILAGHVLDTFDRVVNYWSRLREFEADRASLRVGDGRHAATALVRTGMGGGLIRRTLDELYDRPARAGTDVVGAVAARAGAVGFTDPQRHLEDRQPHPTDSHPPTRQRIEALGIPVDDTLLAEASRPVQPGDDTFAASLFADWQGLRETLGADLLAVARAHDQRFQARLEQAASAVVGDTPVHERTGWMILVLGMAGLVLAVPGFFVLWLAFGSGYTASPDVLPLAAIGGVIGAMGVWFLAVAVVRRRRGRAGPFLVVGREGFRCIGIAEPVPWSAVDGIKVAVGQAFITTFHFRADAPLPAQTGRRWSVTLNRRKRTLQLKGYVPRGLKPQAFLDLLNQALRAHRAGVVLRAREAEAAGAPAAGPAGQPARD